ncbi:MAG: hypothetical protein H6738_24360 [Alphaproteobacteria bacterium]|nr:hypothetical protein [Alphaproteobacteria bacterium]MCB9699943.1 hypothetical protein [Alphaproteobacteria bacterium]
MRSLLLLAAACQPATTDATDPTPTGATCEDAPGCALASELGAGLLSVRAPAADDVWVVGSSTDPDDGAGPVAAHYDGSVWTHLDTSAWAGAELWWVWVGADEVVLVGDEGTILEHDRATGTLAAVPGIDAGTNFFGVWGASADDLWAVGWTEDGDGPPALWRRQGGAWSAQDVSGVADAGETFFKVHGASANDAWIVGTGGLSAHWDGAAWTRVPTDADTDTSTTLLLTVDVGERPIAVGGAGNGVILEWDGAAWRDVSPSFQPGLNGVCSGAGAVWAVGLHGSRAWRDGSGWTAESPVDVTPLTLDDWHGCAVDPEGGLWTVGGHISSRPLTDGVLGYQGPAMPSRL